MIVSMKHLDILCVAAEKDAALEALRALGAVHLDLGAAQGAAVQGAKEEIAAAEKAVRTIRKARGKERPAARVPMSVADVLALSDAAEARASEAEALQREIAKLEPYGDFDPDLARELLAKGVDIRSVADFPDPLPRRRLSALRADAAARAAERASLLDRLASADDEAILAQFPGLADRMAFAAAKELMSEQGAIACISGWIPGPKTAALSETARAQGWGVLLRDPEADEAPPTLIRPPALFRPVRALFEGLGIAPAYREADVSVPFMCYFSIFFAMLVGDGGYGAIILALTLWGWRKTKPKEGAGHRPALLRSWLTLLTVFSSATVLWGILSNTWFGASLPFARDWATVRWLGDPTYGHMMLLCFTIGVSHLVLARVWNGVCKINDTTCLAEFGWAGVLVFMYFVVNWIVGIFSGIPSALYWIFGVSLALVFGFTVKPSELKTRGAELGMLPLDRKSVV